VNRVLEEREASASGMIKQLLVMEGKAPFTLHEPRLAECRQRFLNAYRSARAPLLRRGDLRLKAEELIVRDTFDHALFYMATARAYFLGLRFPSSSTSCGALTICIFSCIPTLYGFGCNDDRSGAFARVRLGPRS
jgi:hypothetical protein